MAAKGKAAMAASAAMAARNNAYVQRLIQDAELRDNLRSAVHSARVAYGRVQNGKTPARALMDDKKLHKELRNTSAALRDAASSLREGPKKSRGGGLGRKLVVLVVGAGLALAVSEGLRNKVLDALFGAEEEFDYQSTTAAAAPPPPPPAPKAEPASAG